MCNIQVLEEKILLQDCDTIKLGIVTVWVDKMLQLHINQQ